jgi:hypothetical protein
MTTPTYPAQDFNRGEQMLAQLGSFWYNVFDDRQVVKSFLRASGNEHGQTYLNYLEALASVSRFTVPIFHTENWYLLTLLQSDANDTASAYQAGDLVYGGQPGTRTGRPEGFVQTYAGTDRLDQVQVSMPESMSDIPYTLQNLTIYPSLVLTNGVDYDIDKERGLLRFMNDPFNNALIPARDIVDDDGNIVDKEIALWAYKGDFDLDLVYTQFGYALKLKLESNEGYKTLLNAFWDMHVQGPAKGSLETMLSALADAPIALDPEETVEVVQTEETSKLVVTSSRVYRASLDANIVVSVGDTIYLGDPITDAFEIVELGGHNPDLTRLPLLSLSDNFLSSGYFSEISFRNAEGEIQYLGQDADGKTLICLEASGFPTDLDRFWELAQERGKADGATLANLLDVRPDPTDEPTADNLPDELNTLEFLLDNILKSNLFIVRMRKASFGNDAPGLEMIRLLRDVIPPHTAYIVFIETSVDEEVIDLEVEGGEDEAGIVESAEPLIEAGAFEETLGELGEVGATMPSYGDDVVLVRVVALDCN